MIKKIIKLIYLALFYIFRILKIKKNKIVITNFNGQGYGDSPKYITEKLLNTSLDIVWSIKKTYTNIPSNVRQVKYQSIKWIYELSTAKVWINNCRYPNYVRKRKGQYYIQTWHGGIALKKIEYDASNSLTKEYHKRMINDTKITDIMISNGDMCDELYRRAFKYNGEILTVGSPRNDELINNKNLLRQKARNLLNISENDKILLYVPTFREDYIDNPYNINFEVLKSFLEKKYECEWHIIIKLHPNIDNPESLIPNINKYINGQEYGDIQELICAADLIITDYSSTMFEGMIAKNPVILYANDIEKYNKDRGLNIDLRELPFPLCTNNSEIIEYIKKCDSLENIVDKYNLFENKIGLKETGKASEEVARLILEKIFENKKMIF